MSKLSGGEFNQQEYDATIDKLRQIWRNQFDERQRRLIKNCSIYAENDPAGLPGHNLMLIIAKMASILDQNYMG